MIGVPYRQEATAVRAVCTRGGSRGRLMAIELVEGRSFVFFCPFFFFLWWLHGLWSNNEGDVSVLFGYTQNVDPVLFLEWKHWLSRSTLPLIMWAGLHVCARMRACVFSKSSQSNPDLGDGLCLTNSPLCLSDQTAGSSPPCQSPHQYKLQGQLFTGRLLSFPLLHLPKFTNHWAIRRWSTLDENGYLCHCANGCDVHSLSSPHIDLLSPSDLFSSLYLSAILFSFQEKGAAPTLPFLPQGCNFQQEVNCGFPAHFLGSLTYNTLKRHLSHTPARYRTNNFTFSWLCFLNAIL